MNPTPPTIDAPERREALLKALRTIAFLRPAGDIETARGTRDLVKRMEAIAMRAIEEDRLNA